MTKFDRISKKLLATAKHGRISIRNFEAAFPNLTAQLRRDASAKSLDHWGHSVNWDEFEKQIIVDPKLLATIGRIANFPIRNQRTYHAGLMHTYGYLLSNLKTRYGSKRERWTSGVVDSGLGMAPGTISDNPKNGTLLQNLTFLLSKIVFERASCLPSPTTELEAYQFDRLKIKRIKEVFTAQRPNQKPIKTQINADFVKLKRGGPKGFELLVYSYRMRGRERLATCFPVDARTRDSLIEQACENRDPIRPRFNLVLEGLPAEGVMGTREIISR